MAKTVKSGLAAKFGGTLGKVIQEASSKEIDYGRMDMPGGVKQGVAKLVEAYFKQYENGEYKGEYFFRAAGVAVEPDKVDNKQVKGLYTSIMEPLCDTKKRDGTIVTKEEHMMVVINELRKLGADMDGVDEDSIESVAAALAEAGPYFRFSTTEGKATPQYPNPRVFENWHGVKGLEDYVLPNGEGGGVEDNTAAPASQKKNAAPSPTPKASTKKAAPAPKEEEDVPFGDKLDMLVDKADAGDEEAQTEIQTHALGLGITEDEVNNTASWAEVAELIRAKEAEGEGGDDSSDDAVDYDALGASADEEMGNGEEGEACAKLRELAEEAGLDPDEYPTWSELATALNTGEEATDTADETPATPAKGEVWYYKPKGAKKPMEVEVIAVFEKNSTCNVKGLDDGKAYKSVPFAELKTE